MCSLALSTSCNANISPYSSSSHCQQHTGVLFDRLLIPTQPYITDLGSMSGLPTLFSHLTAHVSLVVLFGPFIGFYSVFTVTNFACRGSDCSRRRRWLSWPWAHGRSEVLA
ncbi:hypothetical protein Ddye_016506 [Dipteronia dyeriana]|uniref:Uncharacterized protein n=1 Tax=Dipteronia dyeriana TaxID=168575 RepID=A0AAD9U7S2_9ROSI|nr:hypothetical protein Ddye_016506 [Dipteronia dyeriana]